MSFNKNKIKDLDQNDPLSKYRSEFQVSDIDLCYLDGNSLGRLPLRTVDKINSFLKEEWGKQLVEGWEDWIDEAQKSGDLLARNILGANTGEVLVCDTTSIISISYAPRWLEPIQREIRSSLTLLIFQQTDIF